MATADQPETSEHTSGEAGLPGSNPGVVNRSDHTGPTITESGSMKRILFVVAALVLTAATADAGPIIEAVREWRQSRRSCQPVQQVQYAAPVYTPAPTYTPAPVVYSQPGPVRQVVGQVIQTGGQVVTGIGQGVTQFGGVLGGCPGGVCPVPR